MLQQGGKKYNLVSKKAFECRVQDCHNPIEQRCFNFLEKSAIASIGSTSQVLLAQLSRCPITGRLLHLCKEALGKDGEPNNIQGDH